MDSEFRDRLQRDRDHSELRLKQAVPYRGALQPGAHRDHRNNLGGRNRQRQGPQVRVPVQTGLADGLLRRLTGNGSQSSGNLIKKRCSCFHK